MLKANSQINEITQREYIKGYEAHLSASQICLPGHVFSEEVFPGFCFGLTNTGTWFLEHWYPVSASALIKSSFSPVAWAPQLVCLVGLNPLYQAQRLGGSVVCSVAADASHTGLGGWNTGNLDR